MNCPYCNKEFNNWKSVRGHTSHCLLNNGEYYIDLNEGPLHYTEFFGTFREVRHKYPNLKSDICTIRKNFKKRNIILNIHYQNYSKEEVIDFIKSYVNKEGKIPLSTDWLNNSCYPTAKYVSKLFGTWNNAIKAAGFSANISCIEKSLINRNTTKTQNYTKDEIINYIKLFYKEENRVPTTRDFIRNIKYPGVDYIQNLFGTWNNAIKAAGFPININSSNLYGTISLGKDGILYRSNAEVIFVNNFLYEKEIYEYETKYPEPYNKYYDFYLPDRDLYIEIDGGLRPQVIEEKIKINKELNRNLLVIKTNNIVKFKGFD